LVWLVIQIDMYMNLDYYKLSHQLDWLKESVCPNRLSAKLLLDYLNSAYTLGIIRRVSCQMIWLARFHHLPSHRQDFPRGRQYHLIFQFHQLVRIDLLPQFSCRPLPLHPRCPLHPRHLLYPRYPLHPRCLQQVPRPPPRPPHPPHLNRSLRYYGRSLSTTQWLTYRSI